MESSVVTPSIMPPPRRSPWLFAAEITIVLLICFWALKFKSKSAPLPKSDRLLLTSKITIDKWKWISDRELITFQKVSPSTYQFAKIDKAGSTVQQFPVPPSIGAEIDKSFAVRISPDGSKVVYSGSRLQPSYKVYDFKSKRVTRWDNPDKESFSMYWLEDSKRFGVIEKTSQIANLVVRNIEQPSKVIINPILPSSTARFLVGPVVGRETIASENSSITNALDGSTTLFRMSFEHPEVPMTKMRIAVPSKDVVRYIIPRLDCRIFAIVTEHIEPTYTFRPSFPPLSRDYKANSELMLYNSRNGTFKKLAVKEHLPYQSVGIYNVEWMPGEKMLTYVADGAIWRVSAMD